MTFRHQLWTRFEHDGLPIYIRGDKPEWFVPNDRGDQVLQDYMQGRADIEDWQVKRFLQRLPATAEQPYGGRAALLKTDHLQEVWFHLTNRCNQACRHCLFSSSSKETAELSGSRIREIAAQAAGLGCRVFSLTGGEPFVHPEIEVIVDSLLGHEEAHVVVLTNGILLRDHAEALGRWPSDRFHLQISVDGLEPRHDQVRGKGAFATLIANLAWLKAKKTPFTLSICVNADNLADMPGVVDLAAEAGAANVHFMWFFVRGRGKSRRYVPPEKIFPYLIEAARRAEAANISIDNFEVLRSQVFAPSGTIHDGANSGWESLAVGPDGKLYPSPALVGMEPLGTEVRNGLATAWRQSPVLNDLRESTAASLKSPWRFLLGGGDPDHSYLHGGAFMGHDPYVELYEKMAMWLIAQEAGKEPSSGPPGLRLKMGEVLESCGTHGAVALTHTNCLLAAAMPDSRATIKEFYHGAAQSTKTDILNPVCYPEDVVAQIPQESRVRCYGCGSPVLDAELRPGHRVLDLGCGTGVECFIASGLVGPGGHVTGVDMLDSMLELSERAAKGVAANLGYRNVEFKKGYLEELPMPDSSTDVVLSNCVINLSPHKRRTFAEILRVLRPGGRLVISDVVCETEPDAAIRNDEVLRGECISGAFTQSDLFRLLEETGFVAPRVLKRFPYRVVQGHQFFSMTYEAKRPLAANKVSVMYRGPFAALVTHTGAVLPVGETVQVDLDELLVDRSDLLVFDKGGKVINMEMTAPACCTPAASNCCSEGLSLRVPEPPDCCSVEAPDGLGGLAILPPLCGSSLELHEESLPLIRPLEGREDKVGNPE
jgi:7,8-dihydro-6-hydroxymethylpterin dimethyltransferase